MKTHRAPVLVAALVAIGLSLSASSVAQLRRGVRATPTPTTASRTSTAVGFELLRASELMTRVERNRRFVAMKVLWKSTGTRIVDELVIACELRDRATNARLTTFSGRGRSGARGEVVETTVSTVGRAALTRLSAGAAYRVRCVARPRGASGVQSTRTTTHDISMRAATTSVRRTAIASVRRSTALPSTSAACTPDCAGKNCGPDGCGGSCGPCTGYHTCTEQQRCVCVPTCGSAECGPDGCGGDCGTCEEADEGCLDDVCQNVAIGAGSSLLLTTSGG